MSDTEIVGVSADEYEKRERSYVACVYQLNKVRRHVLETLMDEVVHDISSVEEFLARLSAEPDTNIQRQEIGSLQTKLLQAKRQHARLLLKRERVLIDPDDLKLQFEQICSIPRVAEVWVENMWLKYKTLPLFGMDHAHNWRRIGRFQIAFRLDDPTRESFMWDNLDGKKQHYHGPPNITETPYTEYGTAGCVGDVAQAIIDSAADIHDFPALVAFSVRYPECSGQLQNDTITLWPLAGSSDVPEWYKQHFSA